MEAAMIALGICVAISATAAVIWGRAQRRRFDPKRDVLDFGTIVQRYYAGSDVTATDVEQAYVRISEATGVPPGELRPDDRFDLELKPRGGWEYDDPLHIFSDELARHAASAAVPVKLEEIITVDDALHLMKRIRECRRASIGSERHTPP
jgi:hypothetical protein